MPGTTQLRALPYQGRPALARHIGKRIVAALMEASVTPANLADAIRLPVGKIRQFMSGDEAPQANTLWQIAAVLDLDISFFFRGLKAEG